MHEENGRTVSVSEMQNFSFEACYELHFKIEHFFLHFLYQIECQSMNQLILVTSMSEYIIRFVSKI